jgi:16S rRNA (adenine1518-N6/adenine1519-N6)-dimethyltransferase
MSNSPKRKKKNSFFVQLKRQLQHFDIHPKKSLGQHFLIDEGALEHILSAAELNSDDIVIEVGPGLGILTEELAKRVRRVIAVEIDTKLCSALVETLATFANVGIINTDILKITPAQLLADGGGNGTLPRYKMIANLPYYITSPIIRRFLEAASKPTLMVITVQKEVGEAITAQPGRMSLLSIGVQFYAKPTIVGYISPGDFYPSPRVESVILRLDILPQPTVGVADQKEFFRVVRCGFTSPRKQLHNALSQGLGISSKDAVALLQEAGVEPQRRAQSLALSEWARIYALAARYQL